MWFEETVWGDWISSLMHHRHRSEANTFFLSPSSPRGHSGLQWRPPRRERVGPSAPLPAVGTHFSLGDRLNVPSSPNHQHGYICTCNSVQLYRFHASATQLCGCNVPPAWVPWIFAHPSEAGVRRASICFLNRKGSAHRSCILRSAILGLAHA